MLHWKWQWNMPPSESRMKMPHVRDCASISVINSVFPVLENFSHTQFESIGTDWHGTIRVLIHKYEKTNVRNIIRYSMLISFRSDVLVLLWQKLLVFPFGFPLNAPTSHLMSLVNLFWQLLTQVWISGLSNLWFFGLVSTTKCKSCIHTAEFGTLFPAAHSLPIVLHCLHSLLRTTPMMNCMYETLFCYTNEPTMMPLQRLTIPC